MRFSAMTLAALAATMLVPLASVPALANPPAGSTTEQRLPHISIIAIGSGSPVVLIPGMSTPSEVWSDLVPRLSQDHRVLLVQVNGFAGDDGVANTTTGMLDGIVSNIHSYLAEHKLGAARVIGHSMGGLLAMKMAIDHPTEVDRLMVVDALPFFGTVFDDSATVESMRPIAETMRNRMLAAREATRAAAATPITRDPGGNMSLTPQGRVKIANWAMKADSAVTGQALYEDMVTDLRKDIAAIAAPMTILYHTGDNPQGLNAKIYVRHYPAQPKAKLVPVPGAAHFIMLDQPQRFTEEVKDFLR